MTWNIFSWANDSKKRAEYQHALSSHSSAHAAFTVGAKCVAVLASTFMGTRHPTFVAAVLVVLGMTLLALTLCEPPYFGKVGKEGLVGSRSKVWILSSRPNRLRCSADSALVWIYVCTLLACTRRQGGGGGSDVMLRVLPACVLPWLAGGYWLPTVLGYLMGGSKVAVVPVQPRVEP